MDFTQFKGEIVIKRNALRVFKPDVALDRKSKSKGTYTLHIFLLFLCVSLSFNIFY